VCVLLFGLITACGGSSRIVEINGDPPEVQKLIAKSGGKTDHRPASVRTVHAFLTACDEAQWDLGWYLLDLRASAAWQGHVGRKPGALSSKSTILGLVRSEFPNGIPSKLERLEQFRPGLERVTVRAHWTEGSFHDITMSWSKVGWRLLVLPEGSELPKLDKNAESNQAAPAIDFNEKGPGRPATLPVGGGMGGR
jgi:hypothetical protein